MARRVVIHVVPKAEPDWRLLAHALIAAARRQLDARTTPPTDRKPERPEESS
jgi:hypothetical protein